MTDGPQQSPDTPEPAAGGIPPMPEGPVLRYTPGHPFGAAEARRGRLSGGEQVWTSSQPPAGGFASQQAGVTGPAPVPAGNYVQPGPGLPASGITPDHGAPAQPGVGPQPFGVPAHGVAPAKEQSVAPAVLALVCGVLGVVVPFLSIPLDQARAWIAFPFGVVGLALGVAGCLGPRRMKAMAVVGIVFSVLALVVGVIMVGNRIA